MPAFTSAADHRRVRFPELHDAPGPGGRLRTCITATVGAGILLATFASPSLPAAATPSAVGPVLHWNAIVGEAAIAACIAPAANPLAESRLYAMTQIAVHDALNAMDPRFASYSADLFAPPRASLEAAVAAASRTVMVAVFSELRDPFTTPCGARGAALVEKAYVAAIASIPAGPAREEGVAIGRRAAVAIIEKRRGDGAIGSLTQPGSIQVRVTQFGSTPGTPVPYTPTTATLSWLESGPASWNRLSRTIAVGRHLDLWGQARFLALLNISLTDGYNSSLAENDPQGQDHDASSGGSASAPLMGPLQAPVYSGAGRVLP